MALRNRKLEAVPVKPALNAGLTLFVGAQSLHSDWARLVLAEKDVDGVRIETIGTGRVNEDFLVLNPTQSLPTLVDREGVLPYARVIVEYLDERYPHPPLMPPDPAARARARVMLQQIEHEIMPAVEAIAGGGVRAAEAGKKTLSEALRSGGRRVGQSGYMLGREYLLADCAWAVLLRRIVTERLAPAAELAPWRAYAERVTSRKAFRKAFGGSTSR